MYYKSEPTPATPATNTEPAKPAGVRMVEKKGRDDGWRPLWLKRIEKKGSEFQVSCHRWTRDPEGTQHRDCEERYQEFRERDDKVPDRCARYTPT